MFFTSIRRLPGLLFASALLSAIAGTASECDDAWVRGVFTGRSPRPVTLSEPEAWRRAESLADNTDGAFVLVGSGESMQPLYAPGTILVLQQIAYTELRPGQTALYRNHAGKVVAHVLVTKARDGWRATGLNNPIHDMEPVVADNLVGIIIAAFQPAPRLATVAANTRSGATRAPVE